MLEHRNTSTRNAGILRQDNKIDKTRKTQKESTGLLNDKGAKAKAKYGATAQEKIKQKETNNKRTKKQDNEL